MALTKEKLINRLQIQVGLSKQESRAVVERVLDIIKDTLSGGEDLLISGFGKFSVRQKNARRGRNPQTKENLILRARKVVVFKTSGVLEHWNDGVMEKTHLTAKAACHDHQYKHPTAVCHFFRVDRGLRLVIKLKVPVRLSSNASSHATTTCLVPLPQCYALFPGPSQNRTSGFPIHPAPRSAL